MPLISLALSVPVIGACASGTEAMEGGEEDAAEPDSVYPDLPSEHPLADPFGEDPGPESEWWADAPKTTTWGGGSVAAPLPLACVQSPSSETCCASNQSAWIGTDAADTLLLGALAKPGRCAFAAAGDDQLRLTALQDFASLGAGNDVVWLRGGGDAALGGPGDDTLVGGLGGDTLYGQAGDDLLQPGAGNDFVDAGEGNDTIDCSAGDDVILPGPGRDDVWGGPGDDDVWIASLCEVEPGEVLRGGLGHDTLHTPVPVAELQEAGAIVQGFETIDLLADNLPSACEACESSADCTPERPICQGGGTAGGGYCACEPRFTGPNCDQCAPGYEGTDCLECAEGYLPAEAPTAERNDDVEDPAQLLDVPTREFVCELTDSGTCSTTPGDGGITCGENGSCAGDPGFAGCWCDQGYAGARCELCATHYERDASGECVLGETCATEFCSGRGSCLDVGDGTFACACDEGLFDADCGDESIEVVIDGSPDGFQTSAYAGEAQVLRARRRDDADAGASYAWAFVQPDGSAGGSIGPDGELLACPGSHVDPNTGRTVRCSDPRDTIFLPSVPQQSDPSALPSARCVTLTLIDAGPPFVVTTSSVWVLPDGWLPITQTTQCRSGHVPFVNAFERFMLARGVRGGSFTLSRAGADWLSFGIGWRDRGSVEDGYANPFDVGHNRPVPFARDVALRVTPATPFSVASVTKPFVAGAVRAYAFGAGKSLDEPITAELLTSMGADGLAFGYNDASESVADGWGLVTIRDLLWHRAGLCRTLPAPGQPLSVGGFPEANSPPLPGRNPLVVEGDTPGVFDKLATEVLVGPYEGPRSPQGLGQVGDAQTMRGIVLNELTWAFFEQEPPLRPDALYYCRDDEELAPCWTGWAAAAFILGTKTVYPPGEPRFIDGKPNWSGRCEAGNATEDAFSTYSNMGYSLLARVIEGLNGVAFTPSNGVGVPGLGPAGDYIALYLGGEGLDLAEAYPWSPRAARPACGTPLSSATREPCYRELDRVAGTEVLARDFVHSWRSRLVNLGTSQAPNYRWQFCESEDPTVCATGPDSLWSEQRNAPAAYAIDGYYTGSGYTFTTRQLTRFARTHVVAAARGDWDPARAPTYEGAPGAFTGMRDAEVAAAPISIGARLGGGHGGGLRGRRAGIRRITAGNVLTPNVPRFSIADPDDVWSLAGPVLGSAAIGASYQQRWTDPTKAPPGSPGGFFPTPPPVCRVSSDIEFGFAIAQGDDPANNAVTGDGSDELKGLSKNDIDAYTSLSQLIQDAICDRERGGGTW